MKVHDLLGEKIRPVQTIESHCSVGKAIDIMAAKEATALVVTNNDEPVGIFTDRDVFRCCQRNKNTALSDIALQNAITGNLIAAKPADDISRLIAMMLKADIRHLPVFEKNNCIGIFNFNDLVEQQIESLNDEIDQLKDYIDDLHEAGRD